MCGACTYVYNMLRQRRVLQIILLLSWDRVPHCPGSSHLQLDGLDKLQNFSTSLLLLLISLSQGRRDNAGKTIHTGSHPLGLGTSPINGGEGHGVFYNFRFANSLLLPIDQTCDSWTFCHNGRPHFFLNYNSLPFYHQLLNKHLSLTISILK